MAPMDPSASKVKLRGLLGSGLGRNLGLKIFALILGIVIFLAVRNERRAAVGSAAPAEQRGAEIQGAAQPKANAR